MQVTRSGDLYTASWITGPRHNYLGLQLGSAKPANGVQVEELSVDQAGGDERKLSAEQVVRKVREGVALANIALGTDYQVLLVQFVPTDSANLDIYVFLAQRITEAVAGDAAGKVAPSRGAIV